MAAANQSDNLRGDWPRRLLRTGLALVLFALMMITVIDVIGRDIFDSPLRSAYEVTGLLLMVLFFLGLPVATLQGVHITVGLIDSGLGVRARRMLDAAVCLLCAVTLGALSFYVAQKAFGSMRYGEATMFLRVPLGPFSLLAAGSIALTALILAGQFVIALRAPMPMPGGADD
ncbi:TRAP transporter small permease [Pararhodobacter oceanensis]|uniref:TRAP transporter small permease n=1 Tax=Pararhodobacter oceanensis TaxID=2172121 RepID=UPI003A8D3C47